MTEQRPTGRRDDPVFTRPAGASRSEKRTGLLVLAVAAYLGATVTAFGVGSWIIGLVMLVLGGIVLAIVQGARNL